MSLATRTHGHRQPLAGIGAIAAPVGAVLLLVSTLLHPLGTDPADAPAAFAENAADPNGRPHAGTPPCKSVVSEDVLPQTRTG